MDVLIQSDLPGIELLSRGKVRDIYAVGGNLLIVTTDRISAFDCILPQGIPGKGKILNQMSLFWFGLLKEIPNHLITADFDAYPDSLKPFRAQLEGRSMLVKRCKMEPVECVARGFISGSGWKDYQRTGAICGISLKAGLSESDRLSESIFTPATKAETGHDENINFQQMANMVGIETANQLADLTIRLYDTAAKHAEARGIILADTKFEFGWHKGKLLLADEVLTPDSSRFWPAGLYQPGRAQASFDKQPLRDYLEAMGWNKQPPAPELSQEVIQRTAENYEKAYRIITSTC